LLLLRIAISSIHPFPLLRPIPKFSDNFLQKASIRMWLLINLVAITEQVSAEI
jgi:hypothetical protein